MAVTLPLPPLDEQPVLSWPQRAFVVRQEREERRRLADVDTRVLRDLTRQAPRPHAKPRS